MSRPRPSAERRARRAGIRGFTLIELMIGLAIGLISTFAITQILLVSEGTKRTTTSSTNAQISGVLALNVLRQNIQMAGYGYTSALGSIGCPLEARFNGAAVAGFPTNLVPVLITDGVASAPDSIRILSSSKSTFAVPISLIAPGYEATHASYKTAFPVISVRGVATGDLMVAVNDLGPRCQVFQVTTPPVIVPAPVYEQVDRADDDARWNLTGFPDLNYGYGQYLVNMGTMDDATFTVSANGALQVNRFALAADATPSYTGAVDLYPQVVNLQAYYGKDTDANGVIDTWDATTPTTNAGWVQILAVRVALVLRSDQFEKEEVTVVDPLWDVGANSAITGVADCGASKCITLKIPRPSDASTDWRHYRYKVFDSIVPLRNMLWTQ